MENFSKTIVIYSHPNQTGHCGYILAKTIEIFKAQKADYELWDLYQLKFDPVLKLDEHYTSGKRNVTEENLIFQEKIKYASRLIFIYPTWWNNVPAILKGFFDRIFTSHFAFKYENQLPIGLLKEKNAVVFTSMGGPKIYFFFWVGARALKLVTQDVLGFCGIKAKGWAIGSARQFNEVQKARIEKMVQKGTAWLKINDF